MFHWGTSCPGGKYYKYSDSAWHDPTHTCKFEYRTASTNRYEDTCAGWNIASNNLNVQDSNVPSDGKCADVEDNFDEKNFGCKMKSNYFHF